VGGALWAETHIARLNDSNMGNINKRAVGTRRQLRAVSTHRPSCSPEARTISSRPAAKSSTEGAVLVVEVARLVHVLTREVLGAIPR
jgi:hypothetical protein